MSELFYIPKSQVVSNATHYVKELSSPTLFNHLMRTYAYGYMVAKKNEMKIDTELLYLGSILHDLGLTEPFRNNDRFFEIEGGYAAEKFLIEQGYTEEKSSIVKKAIELHASIEAEKKQPEIALVHIGVMIDAGLRTDHLTKDAVTQIIEEYPRLGINQAMIEYFTYQVEKKNDKKLIPIIEAAKHHSHFDE